MFLDECFEIYIYVILMAHGCFVLWLAFVLNPSIEIPGILPFVDGSAGASSRGTRNGIASGGSIQ